MSKKTLKQKVREVLVMRNTLDRVARTLPKTRYGKRELFSLSQELMYTAKCAHKDLPYYLAIRAI